MFNVLDWRKMYMCTTQLLNPLCLMKAVFKSLIRFQRCQETLIIRGDESN
jgi:hypothetical protein